MVAGSNLPFTASKGLEKMEDKIFEVLNYHCWTKKLLYQVACKLLLSWEFLYVSINDLMIIFINERRNSSTRVWLSVISFLQDDIFPFVSSIFLRRLLLPGVHHNATLYATLLEYSRHLGESELQTLTADGLKKEILSLIEHEVIIVIIYLISP